MLVLLVAHGAANRLSALLRPPDLATIDVAVADGAKAPPAEAAAVERMVATVQRTVPPGEAIYAITRRSDLVRFNQPLIYVLTERDNATDRDFGLLAGAAAQRRTVAALERGPAARGGPLERSDLDGPRAKPAPATERIADRRPVGRSQLPAARPRRRLRGAGAILVADHAREQVQRPAQRLLVHTGEVAPDDAHADQLHPAEEQQRQRAPQTPSEPTARERQDRDRERRRARSTAGGD